MNLLIADCGLRNAGFFNPKAVRSFPIGNLQSAIRNYHKRPSPRRRLGEGAFTLVEVLVALAIFALAAVVLGSAYLNVLNSYEVVARGLTVSEDFAFARQLVLTEPDRTKLEQGGEFDTADGRRARWAVEIASTNLADLFRVNFTCEIPNSAQTESEKFAQTFVVLRPTWSIDPAERSKLKEETKARILELQGKQLQP